MARAANRRLSPHLAQLIVACTALPIVLLAWGYSVLMGLIAAGPALDRSRLHLEQNIQIQDRRGGVLYQFTADQNRIFLKSEEIPQVMKNAMLAIEDERFLSRSPCIDARAVLRALIANISSERTQGASTITQQLVRTLYLTPEKTFTRKFNEVILSCRLERSLSKDEILTLYLNAVGFGSGIYGVEQASQTYFGIPAAKLSAAEAAALASLPQRPTFFSPYGIHLRTSVDHDALNAIRKGNLLPENIPDDSVVTGLLPRAVQTPSGVIDLPGRANTVLASMKRLGMVGPAEFDAASKELRTMTFRPLIHPINAPHFSLLMRAEVESLLSGLGDAARWRAEGLKVRTTLDPALQFLAEDTFERFRPLLAKNKAKNAALVAIDRSNREIVAYVGNADFFDTENSGQIDMAAVPRQPGSSFKPIVYAAAFEKGYTPETKVLDEPIHIGSDIPKNYEGGYLGWMTATEALNKSRNIPAIKVFLAAGGEDPVLALAERAGIESPAQFKREQLIENPNFTYGWPMAIGALEVPLTEMLQMYATIAEHGVFMPLTSLCTVTEESGGVSLPFFRAPPDQAIERAAADGVEQMLRSTDAKPEGYWRSILTIPGREVGAKTGTSNLCFARDGFGKCVEYGVNNVWTFGYDDKLVVGVWVGNADNSPLDPLADGLNVAAPIWRDFLMKSGALYKGSDDGC